MKQHGQQRAAEDGVSWFSLDLAGLPTQPCREALVLPQASSTKVWPHVHWALSWRSLLVPNSGLWRSLLWELPLTPTKGRQVTGVPIPHPHVQGVDIHMSSWGYHGGQASLCPLQLVGVPRALK